MFVLMSFDGPSEIVHLDHTQYFFQESLYKKLVDNAQELMDQEHHKADDFSRAANDTVKRFQAVQAKLLEKEKSSSYEVVANLLLQLEAVMYDLKRTKVGACFLHIRIVHFAVLLFRSRFSISLTIIDTVPINLGNN